MCEREPARSDGVATNRSTPTFPTTKRAVAQPHFMRIEDVLRIRRIFSTNGYETLHRCDRVARNSAGAVDSWITMTLSPPREQRCFRFDASVVCGAGNGLPTCWRASFPPVLAVPRSDANCMCAARLRFGIKRRSRMYRDEGTA